jgi:hypothetical protein
VQRCLSIVTVVANLCGPVARSRAERTLGARPMSSRRGLHIIGSMRALVLSSASILVSLPLCFKLQHFIVYVFLVVNQELM